MVSAGRVFSMQYATKPIDNSGTVVGIKCKDGIMLGVEKRVLSKMLVEGSNRRIHSVNRHSGMAIAGPAADGMQIVTRATAEGANYERVCLLKIATEWRTLSNGIITILESHVENRIDPLLLRVARGEDAERTPVWLMRQAGRYMAEFRKYSQRYPFRHRSETPEIAIELSLQPWRAFQPDGVIMFSDILTPLPALGIEFDMVPGKGPVISSPVRSLDDIRVLRSMDDPDNSLPFIREILSSLRAEMDGNSTLLGFVGTPWTLAAYAMEGSADKNLLVTKSIMHNDPAILEALLDHLTEALVTYVCHQIDCGAQVVQLFDSWAHHLSPQQFKRFSLPYAEQIIRRVKERYPRTPLIFHANGGTGKLHLMAEGCSADVIGLDWSTDMQEARAILGGKRVLQGNVDPMALFGTDNVIREAVEQCLSEAGRNQHILNVGHGVIQGTPEEAVRLFCQLARESGNRLQYQTSESAQKQILRV